VETKQQLSFTAVPEFPLSVLIVEECADDVEAYLSALRQARFDVQFSVVATPENFEEQLRAERFDVILSGYHFKTWAGLDALGFLQSEGFDIPFILVTEPLGEQIAVECLKRGVSDYVLKGELDRLSAAVFHALDQKAIRNEKRQTERMLKSSEARFRALADAVPTAVLIEQGTQTCYANRAAEEITGFSRAELLDKNFWSMIVPSAKKTLIEQAGRFSSEEAPNSWRYKTQIRTKGGEIRDLHVTVNMFRIDGVPSSLICALDITARETIAAVRPLLRAKAPEQVVPKSLVARKAQMSEERILLYA